jgi:hypothetical protein
MKAARINSYGLQMLNTSIRRGFEIWTYSDFRTLSVVISLLWKRGQKDKERQKVQPLIWECESSSTISILMGSLWFLLPYVHVRHVPVTRRREQAHHGCSPRQRLPGRTSSKTGRSSRSRLMKTSWKGWNRLSEFSLISRFPCLVWSTIPRE